jgi:hypothetical protein
MDRLGGALLLIAIAAGGCGNITRKQDDAGVRDDSRPIDSSVLIDAMLDGPPDAEMLAPTEAREITPGGMRMTSATFTFDVQLGHPMAQQKATGSTYTIEGNTAVKP